MNVTTQCQLAYHPLADVLPLIEGKAFDELVASIKANGLRDPITLFDGAILDGRNRYRACIVAGVEPRTEDFRGGDPVAFVTDHNMHRRHLTVGQKAMAMAKFAALSDGRPWAKITLENSRVKTTAEAAKLAGCGSDAIIDARVIKAEGTPDEIAAVTSGTRSVFGVANEIRARRDGRKLGHGGPKRGSITKKRQLAIFQRVISLLCNRCEHIEDMDIPALTDADRTSAERQLTDALRAMRTLRDRVKCGGNYNGGKV
jgi:hypothetical protein